MKPFLKKLKLLKTITPASEWKETTRKKLLFEIKASTADTARESVRNSEVAGSLDFIQSIFSFILPDKRTIQLLKPASVFFSISLLVLTSGIFTVSASQATIPGDTLYKLKLATEKVQKVLTTTEHKKAELEITFAGKRIDELEKIVNDSLVPDEEQDEKVTEVITKFNKNITSAGATLNDLKSSESTEDTLSLAEVIDEKVTAYAEVLKEVADDVSDVVKDAVEDARASAEANSDAALVVIVEQHEDGSADTDGDALANKVDTKITKVEDLLAELDMALIDLTNSTTTDINVMTDGEEDSATSTESLLQEQDEIIIEAGKALKEAKQLVDDGELGGALLKTSDTKALVKGVQDTIDGVADAIEKMAEETAGDVEVLGEMTTSTEALIDTADEEATDEEAETISQTEEIAEEITVTEIESNLAV